MHHLKEWMGRAWSLWTKMVWSYQEKKVEQSKSNLENLCKIMREILHKMEKVFLPHCTVRSSCSWTANTEPFMKARHSQSQLDQDYIMVKSTWKSTLTTQVWSPCSK